MHIVELFLSNAMLVAKMLTLVFVLFSNVFFCLLWPFDRMLSKWRGNAYGFPKDRKAVSRDPLLYTKNSAYAYLRRFFLSEQDGITIFWALKGVNKAYITKHVCNELKCRINTVYMNCKRITFEDFRKKIYWKADLEQSCPDFTRAYLLSWLGTYTTFILDDMDGFLESETTRTLEIIECLEEMSRGGRFNVLILLNKAENARTVLQLSNDDCDIQLLGPKGCGKWTSRSFQHLLISQDRLSLIDKCGTFTPMHHKSIDLLQIEALKEEKEWDNADGILNGYWNNDDIIDNV